MGIERYASPLESFLNARECFRMDLILRGPPLVPAAADDRCARQLHMSLYVFAKKASSESLGDSCWRNATTPGDKICSVKFLTREDAESLFEIVPVILEVHECIPPRMCRDDERAHDERGVVVALIDVSDFRHGCIRSR